MLLEMKRETTLYASIWKRQDVLLASKAIRYGKVFGCVKEKKSSVYHKVQLVVPVKKRKCETKLNRHKQVAENL